nr:helix-turn-helix transcriptional regulator [Enterocloster lavalensis]
MSACSSFFFRRLFMRLKEIRTTRGLSVPKLVELSGVPRRTIQEIENRDDCRVSTAIQLADALGVTLDELCRDEAVE